MSINPIQIFPGINDLPTPPTAEQGCNGSYVIEKINEIIEEVNTAPIAGKSAYEVAVDNGFVGTEADWLLSLKGEDGADGTGGGGGTPILETVIPDESSGTAIITLDGTKDTFFYEVTHFGTATVRAINFVPGKLYVFVIFQGETGNRDFYFDGDVTSPIPIYNVGAVNLNMYGKTYLGLMAVPLYGSPAIFEVFNHHGS